MPPIVFQPTMAALVFWTIYTIWIGLETKFALDPRRLGASPEASLSEGENRDRGSRKFLMIVLSLGIVAGFGVAGAVSATALHSHRSAVFWIGIGLMLTGIALRQMAIRTLGRYFTFTVRVRQEQPVIDFGPYRWIRHPSYTGGLLTLAGVGLALTNWASLILILLGAGIGYTVRISVEENALRDALGEPYAAYMRRTWRLIPFVF